MTIDTKPSLLKYAGLTLPEFYDYFKIAAGSSMEVHIPNEESPVAACDVILYQPHVERIQAILDALFTKSWDEDPDIVGCLPLEPDKLGCPLLACVLLFVVS
jgi:hypothetical protein